MAENELIVELPVGKLVGTIKTGKDEEGNNFKVATFRGPTADLHAWEQREFGIDDKIRTALSDRNKALQKMMSDFSADQFEAQDGLTDLKVNLGIGDGAERFEVTGCKISHYPQKKEDGTIERAEKKTYGAMKCQSQQLMSREVREYHEPNQARIEAAFKKHALK